MLNLEWKKITDVLGKATKAGATDNTVVKVTVKVHNHQQYDKRIRFKDLHNVLWNIFDSPYAFDYLTVSINDNVMLNYNDTTSSSAHQDIEIRPEGECAILSGWNKLSARKKTSLIEGLCKQIIQEN